MFKTTLFAFLVLAATLTLAQQRTKPKGPASFEDLHKKMAESWAAENYGTCLGQTREMLGIISVRRTRAIRAAMPQAPSGYELVPANEDGQEENPGLAFFAASVGNVVEAVYRSKTGAGDLTLQVTSDSPLMEMFSLWMTNPAMLGPDAELIEYDRCKGILTKQGDGYSLQVLIDKDIVEAGVYDRDGDFLLSFLDQKAVDKMATTLAR